MSLYGTALLLLLLLLVVVVVVVIVVVVVVLVVSTSCYHLYLQMTRCKCQQVSSFGKVRIVTLSVLSQLFQLF